MKLSSVIAISAVILTITASVQTHKCLNEFQKPVDWLIALRVHGPAGPRKYIVMDSTSKQWRDTTETELVKPIFDQINVLNDYVGAWNDQPPLDTGKKFSSSYAHAKGVLAYSPTKKSGLYYMHSIPKSAGRSTIFLQAAASTVRV
jgi:hypothetical protein